MKTYIQPNVSIEKWALTINIAAVSDVVTGEVVSGGQAPLDYLKQPIL